MDASGVLHAVHGLTRDISSKGMFILCDSQPPEKTDVQVEVIFQPVDENTRSIRLRAESLVLRIQSSGGAEADRGFAILNRSYRLHNGREIIED